MNRYLEGVLTGVVVRLPLRRVDELVDVDVVQVGAVAGDGQPGTASGGGRCTSSYCTLYSAK